VSQSLHRAPLAAWIFQSGFPWGVWLPYLSGTAILAVGLSTIWKDLVQKRGLNKLVAFGPLFIAIPIAVFGAEHFTAAKIIAAMVPAWLPGHMFWALFCGVCLIAAALSIAARKYIWLSSGLLGVLILLFVLLISVPAIADAPRNRILWVVGLRDLSFSAGAFCLAASQKEAWKEQHRQLVIALAQILIGAVVTFFGVEQILHPECVPGVPLAKATPLWIPAHLLWSYVPGAVFVVGGVSLMINKRAGTAATWLGLITFLLVVLLYVPITVASPADIGGAFNYVADTLLFSGSLLVLAQAQNSS
jgi:uncharacterized membrane protein